MTERSNQLPAPARDYLVSPKALRNLFIVSWVVAALILIIILTLTSSKPRSRYTPADESQYQTTVQEASRVLEEPGVSETGAARIPIERAMQIVAEKGLAEIGAELTAAPTQP